MFASYVKLRRVGFSYIKLRGVIAGECGDPSGGILGSDQKLAGVQPEAPEAAGADRQQDISLRDAGFRLQLVRGKKVDSATFRGCFLPCFGFWYRFHWFNP